MVRLKMEKYQQEYDKYNIMSLSHIMYLQLVKKTILSQSDVKRSYESNFKSKQWN